VSIGGAGACDCGAMSPCRLLSRIAPRRGLGALALAASANVRASLTLLLSGLPAGFLLLGPMKIAPVTLCAVVFEAPASCKAIAIA
jgi:hypothetical protein